MNELTHHHAVEIKIGDVGLVPKLDAIAAALEAIKTAHRDTMPDRCWAAIGQAQYCLAEATLTASDRRTLCGIDVSSLT